MAYVLLLHATNTIAYNIASALDGTEYRTVYLLPRNRRRLFRWSRYFQVKRYARHDFEDDEYLDELCAFIDNLGAPEPVFTFLTSEEAIDFWCQHEAVLEKRLRIPTRDVDLFRNKLRFYQALEHHSVDMPPTAPFNGDAPLPYPFVVKPATRDAANRFQRTFRAKHQIVRNEAELQRMASYKFKGCICQDLVDFDVGDEYSWWGYRGPRGDVVGVTARHMKKFPGPGGRISHASIVDNSALKEIGKRVVDHMDFHGIIDLQFIHHRATDRYLLIDPNPRLWSSHEILLMNEINLIALMLDDCHGGVTTERRREYLKGLDRPAYADWFSSLYNLQHGNPLRFRCKEFYKLEADTLRTRLSLAAYLAAKMGYYAVTRSGA